MTTEVIHSLAILFYCWVGGMLLFIRQVLLDPGYVTSPCVIGKNHCHTSVFTQALESDLPTEERENSHSFSYENGIFIHLTRSSSTGSV